MLRENLPSVASPIPPRMCFRWCRAERVPVAPPGPLSGPPMTWVLAEQKHEHDRTIYFVRLDTWRVDGWHWSLARKRFRQGVIVDSRTLGPLSRVRRPDPDQWNYITHWRSYYRRTWQQTLERNAPCDLLNLRWWEGWRSSRKAMLRSETKIVQIGDTMRTMPGVFYVGEAIVKPQIPNVIHSRMLGASREIILAAEVCPVVQADAGMSEWCQRVWYLDYSRARYFGFDPLDDWTGIVDRSLIVPGFESVPFDPRKITLQPSHVLSHLQRLQLEWEKA